MCMRACMYCMYVCTYEYVAVGVSLVQKRRKQSKVLQRLKHRVCHQMKIQTTLLLLSHHVASLLNRSRQVPVFHLTVIPSLLTICLIPRVKVLQRTTIRSVVGHFD